MYEAFKGACFTPSLMLSFIGLWVFKAITSYTEQKEVEAKMWSPGIKLGTSCTEGQTNILRK